MGNWTFYLHKFGESDINYNKEETHDKNGNGNIYIKINSIWHKAGRRLVKLKAGMYSYNLENI